MALQGKAVRVSYDPNDAGVIFIYNEDWKFVARAESNRLVAYGQPGVSDGSVRAAMRQKARAAKQLRQQRDAARTRAMDVAALAIEAQAAETRPAPAAKPPRIRAVKTALDGQLDAHKVAAGPSPSRESFCLEWDIEPKGLKPPPVIDLGLDDDFWEDADVG